MSEKKEKEFLLGGQAVIEGVMMRSPNYYTVAVRRKNGDISIKQEYKPKLSERIKWTGWPFIRGVAMLGQTMAIGIGALNFSAEIAIEDEEGPASKEKKQSSLGGWQMFLIIAIAVLFAFGLVVFLPLALTDLIMYLFPQINTPLIYNSIDGLLRVGFFIAYILLISLMSDIRRVFQYHGAEHMAVFASELEKEINVENAKKYSPYHPRCGTSFLLFVMVIAIITFSFTPTDVNFFLKLVIRTPLIPVIAGLSYEALRFTAKLSKKGLFCFLSAPGLWLQRLTAKHPDEKQLEVSVQALNHVIALETDLNGKPLPEDKKLITIPAAS